MAEFPLKSLAQINTISFTFQTANRDSMSLNYESKKSEGRELHAAIDDLNKRRDQRMKDIAKLQKDLQVHIIFNSFDSKNFASVI